MFVYMDGMEQIWGALRVPCDLEALDESIENVANWFPDEKGLAECLNSERRPSEDARLNPQHVDVVGKQKNARFNSMPMLHFACGSVEGSEGATQPTAEQEKRAQCIVRLLKAGVGPINSTCAHMTRCAPPPGCKPRGAAAESRSGQKPPPKQHPGIESRDGLTPLHVWAATAGEHSVPVLRVLVAAGADASLVDERGDSPLHCFASNATFEEPAAFEERLELLLAAGATLDSLDGEGRTPLEVATLVRTPSNSVVVDVLQSRDSNIDDVSSLPQSTPL